MIQIALNENWTFREIGTTKWLKAKVPGTVHTDLLANEIIEDPFYRTNEKELQWIDKKDWEYQTYFEIPKDLLEKEYIQINFQGLDTYADVYLNDQLILSANNFFCHWQVEVKSFLRTGDNHLRIYFHSPTQKGLEKLKALGYGLPAVNDQSKNGKMGKKKVSVFVRKPGYHFGWDWGPRLVTSGIWRPIELQAWNEARITDIYYHQIEISKQKAELKAMVEIHAIKALKGEIIIQDGTNIFAKKTADLPKGIHTIEVSFDIQTPKLWWIKELGQPHLYQLKSTLVHEERALHETITSIGLRNIQIIQESDEKGSSFYVALNGVPVFSKGANYIPNDIFLPRVSKQHYQNIIQATVEANMNMLRVWGGGIYENDIFYDLCDQNGILVWQDFMFACSMYPGDDAFLESVRKEAIQNIKRLRNHACIALWCGNNEIDIAWANYREIAGWGWKQMYSFSKRKKLWADYEKLFHKLLPSVVEQYSPNHFYWPSSPYARPGEHATNNSTHGDIHYWGVWHGKKDFEAYDKNIGRFMSEYGFQSFPEFETVKKYTLPEDWNIESKVMAAHQRSGIGNLRIKSYMKKYYQVPRSFEYLLYVGQVLQAEGIKRAIEAHRIAKPYCMGSLYWQINDCWPVASWSSMDYYQRWKAVHYFAKKAFNPILITSRQNKKTLDIYIVSDQLSTFPGEIHCTLMDFSGQIIWNKQTPIEVQANTANMYDTIPISIFKKYGSLKDKLLHLQLISDESVISANIHYFEKVKKLRLPEPLLRVSEIIQEEKAFRIILYSSNLTKNVFLSVPNQDGFFTDNYFDLLPEQRKIIFFYPEKRDRPLQEENLQLFTIWNTLRKNT